MVTICPHTSHKLQPLDRTFYQGFKRYYNSALDNWMRENPTTTFSIYGIAQLAKQAFEFAFTPRNILSGFRSRGIYPLNPDIFTDDDFAISSITDRPPLASTTDLNSSRVELEKNRFLEKACMTETMHVKMYHQIIVSKLIPEKCWQLRVQQIKMLVIATLLPQRQYAKKLRHRNCVFVIWPTSLLVTSCR